MTQNAFEMGVAATDKAVTLGNVIVFPRELTSDQRDIAWLAHELTHVYQYQTATMLNPIVGHVGYYALGLLDNIVGTSFIEGQADRARACFSPGGSCQGSLFRPNGR